MLSTTGRPPQHRLHLRGRGGDDEIARSGSVGRSNGGLRVFVLSSAPAAAAAAISSSSQAACCAALLRFKCEPFFEPQAAIAVAFVVKTSRQPQADPRVLRGILYLLRQQRPAGPIACLPLLGLIDVLSKVRRQPFQPRLGVLPPRNLGEVAHPLQLCRR